IYRALTQLDGYELRPQDILLPDYDAATVAVGEDAMEGSLDEITSRFERSVLTQLYRNYPSTRCQTFQWAISNCHTVGLQEF
ncbi:TyrR/PhhR family helix-turn-helix DNA-binding protein, partial [Pseudomonas aeruginosa]|uniref:TyrR/PhhR family helix-turn-helix DNA-binding protein n=1 Tax=Pseudomonas aeruginosa TaxID=287 RepID=UPI0034D96F43